MDKDVPEWIEKMMDKEKKEIIKRKSKLLQYITCFTESPALAQLPEREYYPITFG